MKAVLEDVHNHLPGRCYQTYIRYNTKLAEAASHGLPITKYCRQCVGFEDDRLLTAEFCSRMPGVQKPSQTYVVVQPKPEPGNPNPFPADSNWPWIDSPGVTVTPEGVVFTVEALSAERVQLVGDFNGWSVEGSDMERHGRYWRKVLNLGPGRHLYRFVVDGNWKSDPLNASVESCPGGHNSVLLLEDKSTEASIN